MDLHEGRCRFPDSPVLTFLPATGGSYVYPTPKPVPWVEPPEDPNQENAP